MSDLPENWEATPGERGDGNYTKWLHNPTYGIEITQYTDPNQPHTVLVEEVEENSEGDITSRENLESRKLETEDEADEKADELMEKYKEGIPE